MIREYDDLDWLEKLSLFQASYSRIQTYTTCNLAFFYTYIIEEPRQFGAAASLGSMLHTTLEQASYPLTWDQLQVLFTRSRQLHDPESQIDEDLMGAGWKMLEEHYFRHEDEIPDIIGREKEFKVVIGPGYFTGYIDVVEKIPQGILITDYKSGKFVIRHEAADDLQLGLYALVAKHWYPDEDIYAQLYYLRTGKVKHHHFTDEDLNQVEQRIIENVNVMIDDNLHKATTQYFPCNWCDHRKSGACAVGVKRFKARELKGGKTK